MSVAAPQRHTIITIDGPAGTGKSTTARALARRLGFAYLDSGALYRTIALAARRAGIAAPDDPRLAGLLAALGIRVWPGARQFRVFLGTSEVTAELRDQSLGQLASRLAQSALVRTHVGGLLRMVADSQDCVAEGRDMGSAIFPQAALKIYLEASLDARARRRYQQLRRQGLPASLTAIRAEIAARDERDRRRAVSPLRAAADALVIDNSDLTRRGQLNLIVELVRNRGRRRGPWIYRLSQALLRIFFRNVLRARVSGSERLPRGAYLLACNHRAYVDPPFVGALTPGALAFLAKAELFRVPLFGFLIRAHGAIPVRRGAFDRAALRAVLRSLRQARPVLLFPEGTRRRSAGPTTPRPGVALLARLGGVPVVPAQVAGTEHLAAALRGRVRLGLTYGAPLHFPRDGSLSETAFAERVMAAIRSLTPPA